MATELKITGDEPINMATTDSGHIGAHPGLTIRQHFAAMAEVDIDYSLATAEKLLGRTCSKWDEDPAGNVRFWADLKAMIQVIHADALIAALNQNP